MEDDPKIDIEGVLKIHERREFLYKNACSPCPICSEAQQIQLTDPWSVPAQWRCRLCGHRWHQEPQPKEKETQPKLGLSLHAETED